MLARKVRRKGKKAPQLPGKTSMLCICAAGAHPLLWLASRGQTAANKKQEQACAAPLAEKI